MDDSNVVAPHRGFSSKAREVLIGDDDMHLHGGRDMGRKSNSDADLLRKLKACSVRRRRDSQSTNDVATPKSISSSNSVSDQPPQFDAIGEAPVVKHHKRLGQIGKTRSCMEFKHVDKRLIRTYQEDNIIKMPSIGSDMDSIIASRSDCDASMDNIDGLTKGSAYTVTDEQKSCNVKKWLMEKTED